MAIEHVEIVNPNGRKGTVAKTSAAASAYKQPPSSRQGVPDVVPGPPTAVTEPAKSASTEDWRAYASNPATPNGLSSDEADQMSRDQLVAHFNESQED